MKALCIVVSFTLVGISGAQWCMGGELIKTGLSRELQLKILERHNQLRDQVAEGTIATQPMAQNMKEMIWDHELANRAQAWANRCIYNHDPDRRFRKGQLFGQNLSHMDKTWSTDEGEWEVLSKMIADWFDEVYTRYGYQSSLHFSQMVWANTHRIGCGYSEFKKGGRVNAIFVCNYFPSGNILGKQPYESGARSCEKHGLFASRLFRNLCAAQDENGFEEMQNFSPIHHTFSEQHPQVTPIYQSQVYSVPSVHQSRPWSIQYQHAPNHHHHQPQNAAHFLLPSHYGQTWGQNQPTLGFESSYETQTPGSSLTSIQGLPQIPGYKTLFQSKLPSVPSIAGQYQPAAYQTVPLHQPESQTIQYQPMNLQYGQFQPYHFQVSQYQPGSFQTNLNHPNQYGWAYQPLSIEGSPQTLKSRQYRNGFRAPTSAARQVDVGMPYPIVSPVMPQMGFHELTSPTVKQASTIVTTGKPLEIFPDYARQMELERWSRIPSGTSQPVGTDPVVLYSGSLPKTVEAFPRMTYLSPSGAISGYPSTLVSGGNAFQTDINPSSKIQMYRIFTAPKYVMKKN